MGLHTKKASSVSMYELSDRHCPSKCPCALVVHKSQDKSWTHYFFSLSKSKLLNFAFLAEIYLKSHIEQLFRLCWRWDLGNCVDKYTFACALSQSSVYPSFSSFCVSFLFSFGLLNVTAVSS
jgi:hypothetical protein